MYKYAKMQLYAKNEIMSKYAKKAINMHSYVYIKSRNMQFICKKYVNTCKIYSEISNFVCTYMHLYAKINMQKYAQNM